MEVFSIKNLNFSYPQNRRLILDNINLSINRGEFVILCGPSGCGKTSLLKHFKSVLAPFGLRSGEVYFHGSLLKKLDYRQESENIGFVLQNPENQIVTDKVWHELAFGLESLGYDNATIRLRVAETASFFGIQGWFYKDIRELSGGQKQILNLASIMVMQPEVLILDEPTSQLDSIAASKFIDIIEKINREIGTTVIIAEHRLEEIMPLADRLLVMDNGKIIANGEPKEVGQAMGKENHRIFSAMPVPMQIYAAVDNKLSCPLTVKEGKEWLDKFSKVNPLKAIEENDKIKENEKEIALEVKEVWFRYEKEQTDVVRGLSLKVEVGEFISLIGGNGSGKSTSLSLISGINKPYMGRVVIYGNELSNIANRERFNNLLGYLPQNPQILFEKNTVRLDLYETLKGSKFTLKEKELMVEDLVKICSLSHLMEHHPYDLSGGEQQRLALAKVLLLRPKILLLDEPTKGLDGEYKKIFAGILKGLLKKDITIIMVSHDIEFCAKYSDRIALFFNGDIVSEGSPRKIFSGNNFYTTAANRLARHLLPRAITAEDVIKACGANKELDGDFHSAKYENILYEDNQFDFQIKKEKNKISKKRIIGTLLILFLVPITILGGIFYFGDRKYYFISLLIMLETIVAFLMVFEGRRPQARELVLISVLCTLGVTGRAAFIMLPQFKPVTALVIISGVSLGGESGFLVGGMTMFLSNILYGQGPWTPWQMFSMGIIGFLAGELFKKGLLKKNKFSLSIYGGLASILIYGGIMNPASIIIFQSYINWPMIVSSWLTGLPFDLVHGGATVFFLMIMGEPILGKLDRIKIKYGILKD